MGRLTLNVLLSFAQFEREVFGERIRDKVAASKRRGMWMGGLAPLGYDARDRHLLVDPDEARKVKLHFRSLPRTRYCPRTEEGPRDARVRVRDQSVQIREDPWRHPIFTRRALSSALQPNLRGRNSAQERAPPGTARSSDQPRGMGSSPTAIAWQNAAAAPKLSDRRTAESAHRQTF
jgi:hypothetical protein